MAVITPINTQTATLDEMKAWLTSNYANANVPIQQFQGSTPEELRDEFNAVLANSSRRITGPNFVTIISTFFDWVSIHAVGPKGDQGDRGPAGATGAQGPMGDQGPQGDRGPQGDPGAQGPMGVKGDQGDRGPAGAEGMRGQQGPQGPMGAMGIQGDQGPAGAARRKVSPQVGDNRSNSIKKIRYRL